MELSIKVGDQVHVKNHQQQILGQVVQEIEQGKYLIEFKQGKMVVHDAQDLILYTPKTQKTVQERQKKVLKSLRQSTRKHSPQSHMVFQEDKAFLKGEHKPTKNQTSKLKKIEHKKQRKQMQKVVVAKLLNKLGSTFHQPQLNTSGQLRMLIDKFNQFFVGSWCNKFYTEQITAEEVQRLASLLSLETKLDMKQMLNEWLIERFIVLRKDLKQFKLHKYKHIQKLFDLRYKQILQEIHSKQFYIIDMREQRRNYIFAKIKSNKLDIYPHKS